MAPADPRLVAQVELILDRLKGSAAYPPDWRDPRGAALGDVDYIYRESNVLVRDRDVERVVPALQDYLAGLQERPPEAAQPTDGAPPAEGTRYTPDEIRVSVVTIIEGIARLDYGGHPATRLPGAEVPAVLDHLDAVLGIGVAKPDHVLYVCSHCCPAHEPEEVPPGTAGPFPTPGSDHGCDCAAAKNGCGRGKHCCSQGQCEGKDVSVSIADLGLLQNAAVGHPWLLGVTGQLDDAVDAAGQILAYGGHGTFAAGCVRVTAPQATVDVTRAFRVQDAGAGFESDVVLRTDAQFAQNPDIVVFTFTTTSRGNSTLIAFDALYEARIRPVKGIVVVAPAGNEGKRDVQWPAAYPWVVSVGALSANWRTRAHFSNFGGWVDVYAPGEDLINAFATGSYRCSEPPNQTVTRHFDGMAKWSGTSFSTPLVAGLIASRMSCTGQNGQQAADSLLRLARNQAIPGVGAVLLPGQACCEAPCGCGC